MKKLCKQELNQKLDFEAAKKGITRRDFLNQATAMLMFPTVAGLLGSRTAQAASSTMVYLEIFPQDGPSYGLDFASVAKDLTTITNIADTTDKTGFGGLGVATSDMASMGAGMWKSGPMYTALLAKLGPTQMNRIKVQFLPHQSGSDQQSTATSIASSMANFLGNTVAPGLTNNVNLNGATVLSPQASYAPIALSSGNPVSSLGAIVSPLGLAPLSTMSGAQAGLLGKFALALATSQRKSKLPESGNASLSSSLDSSANIANGRYGNAGILPDVVNDARVQAGFGTGTLTGQPLLLATIAKAMLDGITNVGVLCPQGNWDYHNGGNISTQLTMHTDLANQMGSFIKTMTAAGKDVCISIMTDGGINAGLSNAVYGFQGDADGMGWRANFFISAVSVPNVTRPYVGASKISGQTADLTSYPNKMASDQLTVAKATLASAADFAKPSGGNQLSTVTQSEADLLSAFRS